MSFPINIHCIFHPRLATMFEPLKGGSLVFVYFISCYIILGVAGFIFRQCFFFLCSHLFSFCSSVLIGFLLVGNLKRARYENQKKLFNYFFASWLTSTKFFFFNIHFFSCILVLMLLTAAFAIYRKFPSSQCYTMFLLLLFLPFTNVLLSFCISIGCGIASKYNGRIPLCTQHPKAI